MLLRPGDTFAGCRITALCGSGGMGVVYLAQDAIGRTVAVKIVALCDFQRELAGIRRYIRTADGQPNLIQIFHAGIEQDCLYYIMEAADNLNGDGPYVPKTLSALLARDGKLPPRDTLELIRPLAAGLQVLHHDGLIHRDIKPENIIFVRGVPKLCDPGLVCTADATASLVGTLGYLPPECFKGDNLNTPGRDLYALGRSSTPRSRANRPRVIRISRPTCRCRSAGRSGRC
ncbi:MAG: serine/threonine protein kinase [Lentisphaeria bacterium]|nr:serine/threonine protein kinase [Lentisphaeria bacterium]